MTAINNHFGHPILRLLTYLFLSRFHWTFLMFKISTTSTLQNSFIQRNRIMDFVMWLTVLHFCIKQTLYLTTKIQLYRRWTKPWYTLPDAIGHLTYLQPVHIHSLPLRAQIDRHVLSKKKKMMNLPFSSSVQRWLDSNGFWIEDTVASTQVVEPEWVRLKYLLIWKLVSLEITWG